MLMLPILWIDLGRKSWNEAAALVICDHTHPIAMLYASTQYVIELNNIDHTMGGGEFSVSIVDICSLFGIFRSDS